MSVVTQMRYRTPDARGRQVETLSFRRLRSMNDGTSQRADFHVLAFVDAGTGAVTVDFTTHPLQADSVAWIPSGAVHRWDDIVGMSGDLVLFTPTAPMTEATRALVADPGMYAVWTTDEVERPFIHTARDHLLLETRDTQRDQISELPTVLLTALLGRLRPRNVTPSPVEPLFRAFQAAVEADFRTHHDAEHYARLLGYAPRTVSRAVQRSTGRTAKAYLVERLILEAKRLLAHDRLTAAACGAALGFTDASNFSTFFLSATGQRPGAWQRSARLEPVV